jgi:hypothetical protein
LKIVSYELFICRVKPKSRWQSLLLCISFHVLLLPNLFLPFITYRILYYIETTWMKWSKFPKP